MATKVDQAVQNDLTAEVAEWIEAFDEVVAQDWEQGAALLAALRARAREAGVPAVGEVVTPYVNTIPKHEEVPYPGDRQMERRMEALIRWNAMAMVHRQNKKMPALAATSPPTPRWPRCWKWASTTSSALRYGDQPGRLYLFPGPRLSRRLCACLPRRPLRRRPPQ